MPNVSLSQQILIIAAVLSLPGGLFAAWFMSRPGRRLLGMFGGLIGAALTALGLWYFVTQAAITIEAVSWFLGVFLACSIGIAIGALLMSFFFGGGRGAEASAAEA